MLRHGEVRLHKFRDIRFGDDAHHILFIAETTVPELCVLIPPICWVPNGAELIWPTSSWPRLN